MVVEGGLASGVGLEGDGAGGPDAAGPVVRQEQRRVFGRGVDAVGPGLLVVVGRGDARRPGGAVEGGRVPEHGEAVEEGGHVFVGEVEGVVRRQAVGPDSQGDGAEGLALGNPERILRAVQRWESVGVDRINFRLNCMEEIPQEQVLKSLRLFAREVMPRFQSTGTPAPSPVGSAAP